MSSAASGFAQITDFQDGISLLSSHTLLEGLTHIQRQLEFSLLVCG